MVSSKKPAPMPDELLERMEELGRELGIAQEALDSMLRRRRQPHITSGFPFSLLERVIRSALALLERMVARVVRAVIR